MMGITGLKDINREILKYVSDKELLGVCSINRRMWNDVCDDNFLKRRLSKYPIIEKYKKDNESWKQFFLQFTYYILKMRDYKFEYTSGNFNTQYILLKKCVGSKLLVESARVNISLVEYSLTQGADIHAENDDALRLASQYGYIEIVKYLVEHGADIHAKNNRALRWAKNVEIVIYLVEHGADIHAKNDDALKFASTDGNLEIVKYLIEHGANIHTKNDYALRWASRQGNLEIVKYLVLKGANIHAKNDYALRWATTEGHMEVVKYLKEYAI